MYEIDTLVDNKNIYTINCCFLYKKYQHNYPHSSVKRCRQKGQVCYQQIHTLYYYILNL